MIKPKNLPTKTGYCNHCGRETEQYATLRVCAECLLNPDSRIEWEKPERQKELFR